MVFQRPTPFDGSVLDNLRVADPTIDATSAVAWCARVGLPADVVEQTATTLSGGEAQRMCLARTLATRPQVVLMDEPTSALDHENALRIEDLARTLVDSDGISVIWVSHDRAQVERIADEER